MATIQQLDGHCPATKWPPSNITWSLHIQSNMYSRLAKTPRACIQVEDGHYPGTGWPLSRNWMATFQYYIVNTHTVRYVQQACKDSQCMYPGSGWPLSTVQSRNWMATTHPGTGWPWPLSRNWMATVQQLDGHYPATGWPPSSITCQYTYSQDMYSRLVKIFNACIQVGSIYDSTSFLPARRV